MANATVSELATELKVSPETLLEQLRAAGVGKSEVGDSLSEKDKTQLLDYLRGQHGRSEPKTRITLTRKKTSEIKTADSNTGKARTIQVEVRKKRVLVKQDTPRPADTDEPVALDPDISPVAEVLETPVTPPVLEPVAEAPAPEVPVEVEPEPLPVEEPVAEVLEVEAGTVEASVQRTSIDEGQRVLREEEARRQAELRARQAADAMDKQARNRARKEAEQKAQEEAQAAAAKTKEMSGTLHRPAVDKKDDKPAVRKAVKKTEKTSATAWVDEGSKRRGLKTRGDTASNSTAWRDPRSRHAKHNR